MSNIRADSLKGSRKHWRLLQSTYHAGRLRPEATPFPGSHAIHHQFPIRDLLILRVRQVLRRGGEKHELLAQLPRLDPGRTG